MRDPEPNATRDLIDRFRQGDREAFAMLYRNHHETVSRFAFEMTGDAMTAGEITQDVFVWFMHNPAAYDANRAELGPFLTGVARNLLRRRHRAQSRWEPLDGDMQAAQATDIHDRDAELLRRAIQALPVRYREVVVLCELQGMSYEEAAAALDVAIGTIRSRLHRSRELLARKMGAPRERERCR